MTQITRNNHYVSQALLRRWTHGHENQLWAYRTLVPREDYHQWEEVGPRGAASQRDLYTTFSGGADVDDFERWITRELEEPGLESVDKVVRGARLTPNDWRRMARLVAVMDVRTPASFLEFMDRCQVNIPQLLDETSARIEAGLKGGARLIQPEQPSEMLRSVRIRVNPAENPGHMVIEVLAGRTLWIGAMRHVLTSGANVLLAHRWSIAEPADGHEWITSDHPAMRLNFNTPDDYNFGGGWNNARTDVMMPLSPRHLLWTEVGVRGPTRLKLPVDQTLLIQRLLAKRAHRWIFAREKADWVSAIRPRDVNLAAFVSEQALWREWHDQHRVAELEISR